MNMNYASHPDDERLAALAGADPDVTGDAELGAHVAACYRCRTVVDDISLLRSALAELPDLVPSRPLQLLPPVADAPAAGGGWMRRLFAPLAAAGAGLVLVGAVGSAGFLDAAADGSDIESLGAANYESDKSAGPAASGGEVNPALGSETQGPPDSAAEFSATPSMRAHAGGASPQASVEEDNTGREVADDLGSSGPNRTPWVVLLFAGAALTGGAFLLRLLPARAG